MHVKGIGIILIVLGTSGIGYLTAADLKRHLNDLKWLRRILLLLKEEIAYTHAPLEEAFARISRKVKAPYCLFLTQVSGQLARRAGDVYKRQVPNAGEIFVGCESDKEARSFAETFISQNRVRMLEETRCV